MEGIKISAIRGLFVLGTLLWLLPSGGEAATIQVDCSSATLQGAIDKANPGDTLLVSGTCNENVVINVALNRITLDGQGKATIKSKKGIVIAVKGRDITIKGFAIRGGRVGIRIARGGIALVDGNTVENTRSFGVQVVQNSFARIINNTIRNNSNFGIFVGGSSFAWIGILRGTDRTARPNTIQNNGGAGIRVRTAAAARIFGNTITDNKRAGVLVQRASTATIAGNTINGNGGDGILVVGNSTVNLGSDTGSRLAQLPNNSNAPNGGFGIRCSINSSADGRLGTLNGSKGAKDFSDSGCVDSLKP
jgi:parallel beta-helix repeat protein